MRPKVKKREELFLKSKPYKILNKLDKEEISYATSLAKDTNSTYTHVIHILQSFEKLGLIEARWDGRTKLIKITDKGKELSGHIDNFNNFLLDLEEKEAILLDESEKEIELKYNRLNHVKNMLSDIKENIDSLLLKSTYRDLTRKIGAYKKQLDVIFSSNEDINKLKFELSTEITNVLKNLKKSKRR